MRRANGSMYGRGAFRVLAAAGMALAAAGCSNSSRFDMPAFGLTGNNSTNADLTTTASVPVPSETVYSSDGQQYYGAKNQAGGAQVARSTLPPPSYGQNPRVTPAAYTPNAPAQPHYYGATKAPSPLPQPAISQAPKSPQEQGFRVTVGPGDTLASLSKRYAVPVEAIVSANDLPDARLTPGQEVLIPTGAKAAAPQPSAQPRTTITAAPGENTYKVESGDTLNSISAKLGVSAKALTDRNNIQIGRAHV